MADIAAIFSWPPSVMDPMTIDELVRWRAHAAKRSGGEEK